MNTIEHYKSISKELDALKDRVRNIIDNHHWLTDGEWKESVLRSILRRHVPGSINIGRGFICSPDRCSTQIDILLYTSEAPILFKDGDLAIVTPDAVRGIIEVKANVDRTKIHEALRKLAGNASLVRELAINDANNHYGLQDLFVGLFSYNSDMYNPRVVLDDLKSAANSDLSRVINHVCLGDSCFFKFWKSDPGNPHDVNSREKWHSYSLTNLAPAYFIYNLLYSLCRNSMYINHETWFPANSKENKKTGEIYLREKN